MHQTTVDTDYKTMDYTYSATGEKKSVTYNVLIAGGNYTYCDNFIYYNGSLSQILVDGGYISFNGSTPTYHYYLKDHLGSNRVAVNTSGTIKQVNHYYPFGGLFGESTGNTNVSYRYNNKEFIHLTGEDWYDYGARYMDCMRFTTMDPMAEKYYSISPYAYCANNPIRMVDYNGTQFTESAWTFVNRLNQNIENRINKNELKINKIKEKENSQKGLSRRQQKKLDKIKQNNIELQNVRNEINVLASSNQIYDIVSDNSMNVNGTILGDGEYKSGAMFNYSTGVFELHMGDSSLASLAHELKHAYQFEIGAFSSGFNSSGIPFYDKYDEYEAYKRGELFGGPTATTLSPLYDKLQSGPMDVTNLNQVILSSPSTLQDFANRMKSAFRYNNQTYYWKNNK